LYTFFIQVPPLTDKVPEIFRVPGILVGFSGMLGLFLLSVTDRRLLAGGLLVLAYVLPFGIITPYFFRYRMPIEPILVFFAGLLFSWLWRRLTPAFQTIQITKEVR